MFYAIARTFFSPAIFQAVVSPVSLGREFTAYDCQRAHLTDRLLVFADIQFGWK